MDSFMNNHQSALDSFMEDKAIQDLEMRVYIPYQMKKYPKQEIIMSKILMKKDQYDLVDKHDYVMLELGSCQKKI